MISSSTTTKKRRGGTNEATNASEAQSNVLDENNNKQKQTNVDPFAQHESWTTQPHTVIALMLGIAVLVYYAFYGGSFSTETNIKRGITAGIFIFLLYSAINLKSIDKYIRRPHPAVWRLSLGMSILYLVFLVFFLFQNTDDARSFLRYLDPSLGVPLPERSYATDCRVFTPEADIPMKNIFDTFNDEFIIAHVLGWFGKTLLIRDYKVIMVQSILFEYLEFTFQHWLENFKECWWDHVIIDVLVCNALGIYLGFKFCEFFKVQQFNWVGDKDHPPKKEHSKIEKVIHAIGPQTWTSYNWEIFSSFKRFLYVTIVVILLCLVDMNAFFLKTILWVPSYNLLNTYRLFLWWFMAVPSMREFYEYVSNPKCKRVGTNSWVSMAIAMTELLICIKFGKGMFTSPVPAYIWMPWAAFLVLFSLWVFVYLVCLPKRVRSTPKVNFFCKVLFFMTFVPLLLMFFPASPDLGWGRDLFPTKYDWYPFGHPASPVATA